MRYHYRNDGLRDAVAIGSVDDAGTFARNQTADTLYAPDGRVASERLLDANGTPRAVTQYAYDAIGRVTCRAVRLDLGNLPGACTLGHPNDRITRTSYDAGGRVTRVTQGLGTSAEGDAVRRSYTPNGQVAAVTDAENNTTSYAYDGFDRLARTYYPVTAKGAQASNGGDYEALGYDANGNVTSRRLRDGQVIGYGYDALDRLVSKDVPNAVIHEYDIGYAYDLQGRLVQARDANTHVTNIGYDALGRRTSEQSNWTTRHWSYDAGGRRTRQTWGDGFFVTYEHDAAGNMTAIRENGGLVLASFGYDDLGRRTRLTLGNGTVTAYAYDAASRLATLTQDLAGGAQDVSYGFTYNAAGGIASRTTSNDAYAFTGAHNVDRACASNGLDRYIQAGPASFNYEARRNLTSDGGQTDQYIRATGCSKWALRGSSSIAIQRVC